MEKTLDNEKVHEALELLSEAAREKKDELRQFMSGRYGHLKEVITEAQLGVSDAMHEGARRAARARDVANKRIRHTASEVDHRVHDEPWISMAWVAGAALVFGFLIGRRD